MIRKTISVTTARPELFIAVNKNRIKSQDHDSDGGVVYLENNTEFQLELYNKTDKVQKADIWINGKQQGSSLVLKPGMHYYLDRFIDTNKKLLFETYDVEDTEESKAAIQKNGRIEVRFYSEQEILWTTIGTPYLTWSYYNTGINYSNKSNLTAHNTNLYDDGHVTRSRTTTSDSYSSGNDITACAAMSSIQTGRVEQGSTSNQSFNNYYGQFESNPNTIIKYHIVPKPREGQKNVYTDEIREYCIECGRRLKKGWKFCAGCGQKL